jgi:hypothetical protein
MKMKVILYVISHKPSIFEGAPPYLHCILYLGNDWTFGNEVEQFSFGGERHGDDEGDE